MISAFKTTNCAQMKKTTPLRGLISAYCSQMGAQTADFRFLFKGHRIPPDNTPEDVSDTQETGFRFLSRNTDFRIFHQLGMEDNDVIHARVRR